MPEAHHPVASPRIWSFAMKSIRMLMAVLPPMLLLAGCMSNGDTRAERLAMYQSHAGAPVRQIRYNNPIGWEEVDGNHILLTMKPKEVWLMKLSGPCLDFGTGSQALAISSQAGFVSSGFDRVTLGDSNLTCRIEEIRPVDTVAMRAAERARDQAPGT
jgi:hypothetical protein